MRIKVTGYIDIDDDEYDPGPLGPLTESAFNDAMDAYSGLDDIKFEKVDDDD